MATEIIPILQRVWRLLRWLPGILFRWYFTRERLAQLIYVDVRPRRDSAVVDLGQTASFTLYLQAINLSPFSVELDRASFRFLFCGTALNASILKKQIIAPGEIATLYISETIPDGYAKKMADLHRDKSAALEGNIEFNCKVNSFAKTVGRLDGINTEVHNVHGRTDA